MNGTDNSIPEVFSRKKMKNQNERERELVKYRAIM